MIKIAHHTFVALKLFTAAYSLCSPSLFLLFFFPKKIFYKREEMELVGRQRDEVDEGQVEGGSVMRLTKALRCGRQSAEVAEVKAERRQGCRRRRAEGD